MSTTAAAAMSPPPVAGATAESRPSLAVQPVLASIALDSVLGGRRRRARLLGACSSAVYLDVEVTSGGLPCVVAVVAAGAVRLPLAVSVAGLAPAVDGGDTLIVGGGEIVIGGLHLRPVRWFDPRPRLGPCLDPAALAALERALDQLPGEATGVTRDEVRDVARGLIAGDPGPAIRLVGRGPGLTPAGDDVVAGAIAAVVLLGRPDLEALTVILAHAVTATTALSAALLGCAAAGQVVPEAAALLHALSGRGDAASALPSLLRVGSTSGAALASGLAAGVRASPAYQLAISISALPRGRARHQRMTKEKSA